MATDRRNLKTVLVPIVTLLLLTACGTTAPTRFYILNPLPGAGTAGNIAANEEIAITLLPVRLPEHLKRSQIVTRQEGHQIKVDEFNRWAEPLDAGFTAALAENLSQILKTERILVSNRMKHTGSDYTIGVDVMRFDGQLGGRATLTCRWSIYSGEGKTAVALKRSRIDRPVNGEKYQDLAAAMSLLVGDLGREIAGQLTDLQ